MDINLKLRSEILNYSLNLEDSINSLLLFNLGIYSSGSSTRLFGKKAGISFKNKIDLLYDIDVLTKEENSDLELLMVIRNKFLHDIECNSFLKVIVQLDNSLKNKFKLHLDDGQNINDEEACNKACANLYLKNIQIIRIKLNIHKSKIKDRSEIFLNQNQQIIYHYDLFFGLINDLHLILEDSELEIEKVRNLTELISDKCQFYIGKLNSDEEIKSLKNKLDLILSNPEKMNNYFGIIGKNDNSNVNSLLNFETMKIKEDFKKTINE